jgi:hypothetical protein
LSDAFAGNVLAAGSAPPPWPAFWPNAWALALSDAFAGNVLAAGSAPPPWPASAHALGAPASIAINKLVVHFVHMIASLVVLPKAATDGPACGSRDCG